MKYIWNTAYIIYMLLSFPFLILKGKWHEDYLKRFGKELASKYESTHQGDVIWLHAVSVGEVLALRSLLKELKEVFTQYTFVLSVVTPTGYEVAIKECSSCAQIIYAPFDLSWVTRRYIRAIKPKIYVCMETEIWPNLFLNLTKEGIPIALVNGRISDKSWKGYRNVKPLVKTIFQSVDLCCVQSLIDQERIAFLGVDKKNIYIVGNTKFDIQPYDTDLNLSLPDWIGDSPVWCAGSTHPKEEEIVLDTYHELLRTYPTLKLILAPRHIHRINEIKQLIKSKETSFTTLSEIMAGKWSPHSILIVDQIGYLASLYAFSSVVFVGKSLVGQGGQNMIEPVALGIPTVVGPHTQNFKDVMTLLKRERVIRQISNRHQLTSTLLELLGDQSYKQFVQTNGPKTVNTYNGATKKTVKLIQEFVNKNE